MVDAVVIGIAVGGVLLLALGGYLIRRTLSDDEPNERTAEQRTDHRDAVRRDNSLPVTKRVGGMTWPAKWALGGVLIIFAVVGVNIYSYYKSGSPMQMVYATEAQMGVVALIAAGGGLLYERKRSSAEGRLDIIYEKRGEDGEYGTSEATVYFDTRDTFTDDHGTIVAEYGKNRLFGLFRQPKRVSDDRRLRNDGDVHRPLSDKVHYRIPEHAIEVDDGHYVVRSRGLATTKSPDAVADFEFRAPFTLSKEDLRRIHSNQQQMEIDINYLRAEAAHKDQRIRQLEEKVSNFDTEAWTKFLGIAERLAPLISRGHSEQIVERLTDIENGAHSARENGQFNGELNGQTNGQYGGEK